jgi:hypothetical protein
MPARGQWYADSRDGGRALRVSWHAERGCVVLSTWNDGTCTGTARLGPPEAARLVALLADGLAELAEGQAAGPDAVTRGLGG